MSNNVENVNKLREYINKNKSKNYPIKNHPLAESTDYIKNIYLKMLCVVLQYGNDIKKEQTLFLERLIAGIGVENPAEDFMRQAINIEIKDFEEFVNQIKEGNVKYCFIVDAMILINVSANVEARQNELIAEIMEMFGVVKSELDYIVLIVKSILEQNSEIYGEAEHIRPDNIDYKLFLHHSMDYLTDIICDTKRKLHIGAKSKQKFDIGKIFGIGSDDDENAIYVIELENNDILFENLIIDLSKYKLQFSGNENIKLENCEFTNGCEAIYFSACQNIYIVGCEFKNFSPNRTIMLDRVDSLNIEKCYFNNCTYYYSRKQNDWESLGGVIYLTDEHLTNFDIKSSEFKDCGGVNSKHYFSSDVISNCKAIVSNSKFINCYNWCNDGATVIDIIDSRRRLFPCGSISTNNENIGSANII